MSPGGGGSERDGSGALHQASRPQISRGALYLFLTLVVLLLAQAGWWVVYQILEGRRTYEAAVLHAQRERDIAALEVERLVRGGSNEVQIAAFLTRSYPHLELSPRFSIAPAAPQDRAVAMASRVRVKSSHLDRLESEVRRRGFMFLGEGSFFLSLILIGIYLIHSTLQREVMLKQQQSNFVSAVTHELKSPLASLRLYLQTFQLRKFEGERAVQYIDNMLQDVDRLEELVENLLEAGRLETRNTRVHLEELELGEEIETFLAGRRRFLEEAGVTLTTDLPEESIAIRADRQALRTILSNLLDNAVKYSSAPRVIDVKAYILPPWGVFEIRDNGIGLRRSELRVVFQKFYRVGNELVRRVNGTGLGLYLVEGLCRIQGGSVEADSPGPGQGSTFRVRLRLEGDAGRQKPGNGGNA